ncbi:MAG: hypothetical protein ACXV8Q_04950 [Methylobacter sp.]
MPKIKHITTGDIFTVAKTPVFDSGIWECGDQRFTDPAGTEYEAVEDILAVINFNYPTASATATDITVDVSVVNPADNLPLPVNKTYYAPLINIITGAMDQMLIVPITGGVGQAVFKVASAGVYSLKTDLIRPKPTAQFSEMPDISVYEAAQ